MARPERPGTLLQEYANDFLVLSCARCKRNGRYSIRKLIAQYGPRYEVRGAVLQAAADCKQWIWRKSGAWPHGCEVQWRIRKREDG